MSLFKARILLYHKSAACQAFLQTFVKFRTIDTHAPPFYNIGMNTKRWLSQHTHDLTGVHVAVTGPTGGLGLALCRYLAGLHASLILLDRNAEKSAALQQQLLAQFPQLQLRRIPLDLADMASVRAACAELKTQPIDILIHNAGAYSIPRTRCDTGLDNVFQINCAAPYYLTRELLPLLRERGGHVVMVSSIAHNYAPTDPADPDFSTRRPARLVYGNAKRRLMFALQELFAAETKATLAVAHPGITLTNITAHYPKLVFAVIKNPMKWIFMSPQHACLSLLCGVFEKTGYHEWIGPRLFHIWGAPAHRKLGTCTPAESTAIAAQMDALYQAMKTPDA